MKKATTIIIRVSDRDKENIKNRAEELQMSMSEYLISLYRADEAKKALG
jgi:predicted DNA binding CopG/RHH family protein